MPDDIGNVPELTSSAMDDNDDAQIRGKLNKHDTMLAKIASVGRVVKLTSDDPTGRGNIPQALVHIGGETEGSYTCNWLPWVTARAGYDGEWWQPDIDEQVLVLAPSGDIAKGYIVGSIYRACLTFDSKPDSESGGVTPRDSVPASEEDKQIHKRVYQDGTSIGYDRLNHALTVGLKSTPDDENNAVEFSALTSDESSGEVSLQTSLKSTLIAGTVDDPKVTLIADANEYDGNMILSVGDGTTSATIKNDGTISLAAGETTVAVEQDTSITLTAGATKITVSQDGAVEIDAGSNDINIAGNVKVTGTLDVS